MEDTTHTVQQWIDDVVKYAPDLHRRIWDQVQQLLPPSSRGHPQHFPRYGAPPVVAHDYPRFDVVKESVITIPEPRTVYGPIDLDDAAAAVAKILDRQVLEVVEHALRIDMQAVVQPPSSGVALSQLVNYGQSFTVGVDPAASSLLTLDDLRRAQRALEQDWSPEPPRRADPTPAVLAAAGCTERGCTVESHFDIRSLSHRLSHNGIHLMVPGEVLAHASHADALATIYVDWATQLHQRPKSLDQELERIAAEQWERSEPEYLAIDRPAWHCFVCNRDFDPAKVEIVDIAWPPESDCIAQRACSDVCATAWLMQQDLARDRQPKPTKRQLDQSQYAKDVALNRYDLRAGPSDSAPIRYPHNPWKDA